MQVAVYATLLPLVLQKLLPADSPSALGLYLEAVGKDPVVQKAHALVRDFLCVLETCI
jgi:hypothetical protein